MGGGGGEVLAMCIFVCFQQHLCCLGPGRYVDVSEKRGKDCSAGHQKEEESHLRGQSSDRSKLKFYPVQIIADDIERQKKNEKTVSLKDRYCIHGDGG